MTPQAPRPGDFDFSTGALSNLVKDIELMQKEGKVVLGMGTPTAQAAILGLAKELLDARRSLSDMPSLGGASVDIHKAPLAKVLNYLAETLRYHFKVAEDDHKALMALEAQQRAVREFFGLAPQPSAMLDTAKDDKRIGNARIVLKDALDTGVIDPKVAKAIEEALA